MRVLPGRPSVEANFSTLKRQSDLFLLTAGANIAEAVNANSMTSPRPKERLLSGFGWGSLALAAAAIVAVT